jgi:hypothetical protein
MSQVWAMMGIKHVDTTGHWGQEFEASLQHGMVLRVVEDKITENDHIKRRMAFRKFRFQLTCIGSPDIALKQTQKVRRLSAHIYLIRVATLTLPGH